MNASNSELASILGVRLVYSSYFENDFLTIIVFQTTIS